MEQAKALVRFRLAHASELQAIASKEDILKESQVRITEHLEVYHTEESYNEAQEELAAWKADMPDAAEEFVAYDGQEASNVRNNYYVSVSVFIIENRNSICQRIQQDASWVQEGRFIHTVS